MQPLATGNDIHSVYLTKVNGPYLDKRSNYFYYKLYYSNGMQSTIKAADSYIKEIGEHGTQKRYGQGCHCHECRTAHTEYMRPYNAKRDTTNRAR